MNQSLILILPSHYYFLFGTSSKNNKKLRKKIIFFLTKSFYKNVMIPSLNPNGKHPNPLPSTFLTSSILLIFFVLFNKSVNSLKKL